MALTKKEIEAFTSSKNPNWETPPYIFNDLHRRFKFTVDGAANKKNSLLPRYWGKRENALNKNWDRSRVFINPPYGDMVPLFAEKCAQSNGLVVAILPCRPGTVWFQEFVRSCALVFDVRGRIQFLLNGKSAGSPLFDSVIAIYNHPKHKTGTGIYLKPIRLTNSTKPEYRPGVLKKLQGRQKYLRL